MNVLLDTHALLWWLVEPEHLSDEVRDAISDEHNEVLVSSATLWEIAVKQAIGKLAAPDDLIGLLNRSRMVELPIRHAHIAVLATLPPIHRDPFDRVLIAQAKAEDAVLATRDSNILRYDCRCLRA